MKKIIPVALFIFLFLQSCSVRLASEPVLFNGGKIYNIKSVEDDTFEPGLKENLQRTFRYEVSRHKDIIEAREVYSDVVLRMKINKINYSERLVTSSSSPYLRTVKINVDFGLTDRIRTKNENVYSLTGQSSIYSTFPFPDTGETETLVGGAMTDIVLQMMNYLIVYN